MNKILELVHQPEWWFSAVIVGVLGGILSAYGKSATDRVIDRLRASMRARIEAQLADESSAIAALAQESEARIIALILASEFTTWSVAGLTACMMTFALAWVAADVGVTKQTRVFVVTIAGLLGVLGTIAGFLGKRLRHYVIRAIAIKNDSPIPSVPPST